MKRNVIIASLAAAGVVGGAAIAGTAFADDSGDTQRPLNAGSSAELVSEDRDDADDRSGGTDDNGQSGKGSGDGTSWVSAEQAVKRALQEAPGLAYGLELEDDDKVWQVDVLTKDGERRQVDIARNGGDVVDNDRDDDDDDNRRSNERLETALKQAKVSLSDAAKIANERIPGTIEEIDLEKRGSVWKVEFDDVDGRDDDDDLELRVNVASGKVTVHDDDGDDDRDDDQDDRDDDQDDDRDDRDDDDRDDG